MDPFQSQCNDERVITNSLFSFCLAAKSQLVELLNVYVGVGTRESIELYHVIYILQFFLGYLMIYLSLSRSRIYLIENSRDMILKVHD